MPEKRLKQFVSELSFDKKLMSTGAILMLIALFMPWYQDIDSFGHGYTYIGFTGPLYLVGFTFLAIAGLSLANIVMDNLGMRVGTFNFRLPFKSKKTNLFLGIFSFYLLFTVNSVYFHANFGVNITLKEAQFGMFIAFIASAFLAIGGYLSLKESSSALQDFEEETRDSFIEMPVQQERAKENFKMGSQRSNVQDVQNRVQNSLHHARLDQAEKETQPFRMDL